MKIFESEALKAASKQAAQDRRHLTDALGKPAAKVPCAPSDVRGWRPIESAPRDGSWVLIRGGNVDCLSWDDPDNLPPCVVARWADSYWQFANYDGGYYGGYENPTQWRTLP